MDEPLAFQALLFGDDHEALAQEIARLERFKKERSEAEARKAAWEAGKPVPADAAKWAVANREAANARSREFYRQTPEWALHRAARSRAQKFGCKVGRRSAILKKYRMAATDQVLLCYWCKRLTEFGEREVDHIRPLSAGGAHNAGNLCIACLGCNSAKGSLSPEEFRPVIEPKRAENTLKLREYYSRKLFSLSP